MNKIKLACVSVLGYLVGTCMAAMAILVVYQVVSRYLFHSPSKYAEELATALMIWVGTFGAALGFEKGAHLGVDILSHYVSAYNRKIMTIITTLMTLSFAVIIWMVGGTVIVMGAFESGNMLKTLPLVSRAWVYFPIPISGALVAFFMFDKLITLWRSPCEGLMSHASLGSESEEKSNG